MSSGQRFSNVGFAAICIGGLLLFAVVFHLVESVVDPPAPSAPEPGSRFEPNEPAEPLTVDVSKADMLTVSIRIGRGNRTRIRLDDRASADALLVCIREGLDLPDPAANSEGQPRRAPSWAERREELRQLQDRVDRVQAACMGRALAIPGLPELPAPPRRDP